MSNDNEEFDEDAYERPQFDTAEDALTEFLERMWYAASRRYLAQAIIDELPWNGYKIVKMTEEERDQHETDYDTWLASVEPQFPKIKNIQIDPNALEELVED